MPAVVSVMLSSIGSLKLPGTISATPRLWFRACIAQPVLSMRHIKRTASDTATSSHVQSSPFFEVWGDVRPLNVSTF